MRTDFIYRDIKTGRLFPGLVEAARHYGVSAQTIWNYVHLKGNRPNGINPNVEAVPLTKLNAEIMAMKREIKKLEAKRDAMVQLDPGFVDYHGDLLCDRETCESA